MAAKKGASKTPKPRPEKVDWSGKRTLDGRDAKDAERRKGNEYVRSSPGVFNDGGAFLRLLETDARVREIHEAYMSSPPLPEQPPTDPASQTLWP